MLFHNMQSVQHNEQEYLYGNIHTFSLSSVPSLSALKIWILTLPDQMNTMKHVSLCIGYGWIMFCFTLKTNNGQVSFYY